LKHRVLVPTINYSTGRGQFFKTTHYPSFELDHRLKIVGGVGYRRRACVLSASAQRLRRLH